MLFQQTHFSNRRYRRGIVLLSLMLLLLLSACGNNQPQTVVEPDKTTATTGSAKEPSASNALSENEKVNFRLIGISGPTGMGFSKLLADSEARQTENSYTLSIVTSPDSLIAAATKNEADIIAMPSNLASVLWNKTEGQYQVLAVNTLGVLNIVEKGDSIHSISDLKGKTILASGKGAAPEYALNYLLRENGLEAGKDLTIEWKSEHQEVVAALAATEQNIALLPQPFVTVAMSKVDDLRIAIDLNETWQALENGSQFVMGVIVANKDFLAENSAAVKDFLSEYKASVDFVNANPAEASLLIEEYKILENAAVAEKAIPNCHIVCLTGDDMEQALQGYLDVLYQADPKSVGGVLPDESLYYKP